MSDIERRIEEILQRLVGDVERSVHALYRGDVRQETMRSRSDTLRIDARQALLEIVGVAPPTERPAPTEPAGAAVVLDEAERAALRRCVMAWLPMSEPSSMRADSHCIPVARYLSPSWGERELARQALQRMSG